NCPFCRAALKSKSALVSPRRKLPPLIESSREENWMFAASESQWTGFSGVREVAGTVNSKSSATKLPESVGEEKVPPAAALNVALPSIRNGKFVGPPKASTSGRHSSRFDVEIVNRNFDVEASNPSPATLDDGVVRLNCASSSESLMPRYFP